MTVIATDTNRFSNTFKHEYEPALAYTREQVVINETTGTTYPLGTVLGKVTATGKYKRVEASAVDGSQTAAAILIADTVVVANTDKKAVVVVRGPAMVSKAGLFFGASVDTDAERTAAYTPLAAVGILAQDAI
jgi:hypothetical protein